MSESHIHVLRMSPCTVKAMSVPQARNMMDTGDKLVIFYKYSPTRQHNLDTWIDDMAESETAQQSWRNSVGPDGCHATGVNVEVELRAKCWSTRFFTRRQAWNQATVNDAHVVLGALSQFQFVVTLNTVRDAIVCA